MRWQCSEPCRDKVWDLAQFPTFRFPLASIQNAAPLKTSSNKRSRFSGLAPGVGSDTPVDFLTATSAAARFVRECEAGCLNAPSCPSCGAAARPAVLLFGEDTASLYKKTAAAQEEAWVAWRRRVVEALRIDRHTRLVILEVGAGVAVPSVRNTSEMLLEEVGSSQCTLVRLNPVPMAGDNMTKGGLSVKWDAEEGLACIDKCLRTMIHEAVR